jgi:hypothetical protein
LSEIGVWIGATGASKPVFAQVGKEGFPFFCSSAGDEGEVAVEGELGGGVSVWITKQEEILLSTKEGVG